MAQRPEVVPAPSPDVRLSLVLGERALHVNGDLQTARRWFDAAYRQAEQSGDPIALGLAALGLGGRWVREHRTSPSARAYALLRPYAGLPVVGSLGVVCFGSVEHPLGMAALTTGDLDLAVRHLRAAVQANLALSRIAGVDPMIGEELRASVQTGLRCCYRPW